MDREPKSRTRISYFWRNPVFYTSTISMFIMAIVLGIVGFNISYVVAWGNRDKIQELNASTDVFAAIDAETLSGGSFTKDDMEKSKITAFNVWETTCPSCLGEMSTLEELSKSYPSSEFQLVGICADVYDTKGNLIPKQVDKAMAIMDNAGITFTNLIPQKDMHAFIRASVVGYPTTFFVDSEGQIVRSTAGAKELDAWKSMVESVIEEQK
ncbi:MAG: TlpA family protein disulfide reductase [Oribacterium sp.]|nr:TlpA family protein disulfide reductase [Oribacterium sp.]